MSQEGFSASITSVSGSLLNCEDGKKAEKKPKGLGAFLCDGYLFLEALL